MKFIIPAKFELNKKEIQKLYSELLEGSAWSIPKTNLNAEVIFWAVPVWREVIRKKSVKQITVALNAKGIETRNGFYSVNRLDIYGEVGNFLNANKFSEECIVLPSYFHLKDEEIAFICESLKAE